MPLMASIAIRICVSVMARGIARKQRLDVKGLARSGR